MYQFNSMCFEFIAILSPKGKKKISISSPRNYLTPIPSPPPNRLSNNCSSSLNSIYNKYYYYDEENNNILTQEIRIEK